MASTLVLSGGSRESGLGWRAGIWASTGLGGGDGGVAWARRGLELEDSSVLGSLLDIWMISMAEGFEMA